MHLYVSLDFYAYQSVFFAATYHLCIIHSTVSYFTSGFGAGDIIMSSYLSNAISFQVVIYSHIHFYNIQCFIMIIPLNILILYVKTCIFSCDFTTLTILYIHVHI